jgi:mRNA interferase HigB
VRVLTKRPFVDAAKTYPNDRDALMEVYRVLSKGEFPDPVAFRATFSSLDNFKYVDKWWVIDIGGNNLRLVACILFQAQMVYVKHILTRPEYDKLTDQYPRKKKNDQS